MRKLSTDLIKSGSFTGSFSGSVVGTITSASFASTASYLLNSFSLTTGSTYPITSSWSNNSISSSFSNTSISSSYSLTSSNLSPVAQDLIPISNSLYSLGSPTNKWKDLYVSTGSIYIGNVVLSTSGSTLYADVQPIVTLNTASGQIEISGMSASLSASYSNTSSVALNAISSSYGLTSSYSFFANDANNSSTSTSASYSSTASVALNALTSSYINVATNAVSSSFASTASISVSSSFAATSSYNLNSISSSYSLTASFAANAGSSLATGSTYPITSSWATTSSNIIGGTSNYIPLWSTNTSLGNSVLYQNSSNIGIGTTSPGYKLDVVGAVRSTIDNSFSFASNRSAITVWSGLGFLTNNVNKWFLGLRETSDDNLRWYNFTNSSERMVLTETGNLGIGTTSPNAKLHISSTGGISSPILRISGSATDTYNWASATIYSNLTSSATAIHLIGKSETIYNSAYFGYKHSADNSVNNAISFGFFAANDLVNILANGNVGIGTTSPAYKLDVNGSASFADNVIITKNQNALTRLIVSNTTSNSSSYVETAFVNDVSSGTGAVGRYGATTTTYKIVTSNNQYLYNGPTAGDIAILNDFASGSIKMSTGGNSNVQFIISSSGNVGIGTTSPVTKLQVNGNISGSSFTGSVFGTSSWTTNASTASYIVNSISSSYALTASYALNAGSGGGSTTTSSLIGQTFVPTASVSQLSLTQSVSNNDQILVILDGLVQSRTGSYTVSGSTLTLTENADSGSNIDVRFLGGSAVSSSYALTSSYLTDGSQILTSDRTVAFSSSFTTAQMQALIDAQPRNLGGKTLTFQFADGNYNLSTGLQFNFFSNGVLLIYGNSSNNTVAASKNVVLSGSAPIYLGQNNTYTEIQYLRASVNTSTYGAAIQCVNSNVNINLCSFTNHPTSVAAGSGVGVGCAYRGSVWVQNSYFTSLDKYMTSGYPAGFIYSSGNLKGTNANIAYEAYGGIIQVQDTNLTSTTTYSTAVGGLIVRPSGTTVGT